MLSERRVIMKDDRPTVVKVTTKNKLGIIAVYGPAVEDGSLTEDNVDEHIEQITPILDLLQPELEKRRLEVRVDEDDLRMQKIMEEKRLYKITYLSEEEMDKKFGRERK